MDKKYKICSSELKEIGQRLKNARNTLNLNETEFAESLYYTCSHQCNLEKGKKNVTVDYLVSIKKLYNISIMYILFGEGNMFVEIDEIETVGDENMFLKGMEITEYFAAKSILYEGQDKSYMDVIKAYAEEFRADFINKHNIKI